MEYRIVPAGDSAWLVELPERLDPEINARAIEIAQEIASARLTGVTDVVVGYRSVMLYVDPLAFDSATLLPRLHAISSDRRAERATEGAPRDIPVCYGGSYGPDLEDLALFGGCSVDDVIRFHVSREYRVYVVGFLPGFAYMAPVDPRIAAPRRPSPRLKVPAGSVAVAAGQTGIYPAETPGGWHLIGRTPVRPYDPGRENPFLFQPGDRVRFHEIGESEYRLSTSWGDV